MVIKRDGVRVHEVYNIEWDGIHTHAHTASSRELPRIAWPVIGTKGDRGFFFFFFFF